MLSSLASGHMVTTAEERQNGVLAIDIGAGTTDYVLYRDGVPHTTGVVPVGGTHLTNDLSIGLRLTEGQAEKLKLRFGRAQRADPRQGARRSGSTAISRSATGSFRSRRSSRSRGARLGDCSKW